jgi:hypothetical protein
MGRRKRDGSPPPNNLIQDSEGNEEDRYPEFWTPTKQR